MGETRTAGTGAADEARAILLESKAILEDDHFVYVTGDHGLGWIDKDALFPRTDRVDRLSKLLADAVRDCGAEVVCGPALGGVVVSQWVAHELGALAVFGEHGDTTDEQRKAGGPLRGAFVLQRGYDRVVKGKRVLVVDDVVSTGYSVGHVATAVRNAGGDVRHAASWVSRGNAGADEIGVDTYTYLVQVDIPGWSAAQCQLCRDHVPVNAHYAHGRDYLEAHGARQP